VGADKLTAYFVGRGIPIFRIVVAASLCKLQISCSNSVIVGSLSLHKFMSDHRFESYGKL
jgi:hypothetical protein